jgi:nucleotide-binding universal stress UspA family protein
MFLDTIDHVLVPLDLSEASRAALTVGLGLGARGGVKVTVLAVVDTTFPYPDIFSFARPDDDYFKTMKETVQGKLAEWLAAKPAGADVEVVVIRGKAKVEIPAFAKECGAKLIIVTTHGEGGFRGAMLGSTTEAVVRTAAVPVLVLPLSDVDHESPLPFA